MIDRLLNELDRSFNGFINYINHLGKSTILQNAVYDYFERILFTSLISSFFSNLTDENIKKCGLSNKEVDELKKYFSNTIREIKRDSGYLDFKVDIEYYNKFILDVANHFPNFIRYLNEVEKSIDIKTIKEYLILKNEIIQESGKKIENSKDLVLIRGVEKYIGKFKEIPALNDPKLEKVMHTLSKDKMASELLKRFSGMTITDWDIWHSYSSYFFEELVSSEITLGTIAKKLIESNFCPLVFASTTDFWFKEKDEVKRSKLEIGTLNMKEFKYSVPKSIVPIFLKGYPLLLLKESSRMWFSEWKLFSEEYRNSFPYIRCFLNPCYLKTDLRTIGLYPQLKLYSNGVFILSFREISSKEPFYIEPFINNDVNLSQLEFDNILIPPEFIKINSKGFALDQPLLQILLNRNKIRDSLKEIDEVIEHNTEEITGDFKFNVVPISLKTESKFNFEDLIEIIRENLFFVVNPPSKRILRRKIHYLTTYRTIRPSIYILEFENQPNTSLEILEQYGDQLGKIMVRVSDFSQKNFKKFLGENLRKFEDFTLHINEALTLWTFSKKSFEKKEIDPNRDDIILEKQIQVEAIDHLYMSHRRLFEISSDRNIPYESILDKQNELLNLEELVTDCDKIGKYGEIDYFIKVAGKELHWDAVRKSTEKKLKNRSEYSNEERTKLLSRFGNIITFIFGLGSLTIFTTYVIIPILHAFNKIDDLPITISFWGSITIVIFIAIIFILLILYWLWSVNKKNNHD